MKFMKRRVKKSLAKTMTVGVSAMTVATMLPVNSFAMDNNENDIDTVGNQEAAGSVAVKEETVSTAYEAVSDCVSAIADAVSAIDGLDGVAESITAARNDLAGTDSASLEGISEDIKDAKNAADEVADLIATASFTESDILKLINQSGNINTILKKAINTNLDALKNATTLEEAEDAYNVLAAAISAAKSGMEAVKEDYADLIDKYDESVNGAYEADDNYAAALEAAKTKISDAIEALKTSGENLDALLAVLSETQTDRDNTIKDYTGKLAELDALIEAKEEEKTPIDITKTAAESELAELKTEADELEADLDEAKSEAAAAEQDLKDAQAEMDANAIALDILNKEKAVQDASRIDYNKCDALFMAIFQNYYVPYVIKPAEGSKVEFTSDKFVKFSDDSLNYYVFKIDGKEYFYNYVVDKKTRELVIFEKTEHDEIVTGAVPAKYVSIGNNTTIEMSEADYVKALNDGTVYEKDGKSYVLLDTSEVKEEFVKADNQTVSETDVDVVYDKNGKTTTTIGSVTTTTYDSTNIASNGDVFASEAAAREDAAGKLVAGDKNLDIKITKTEEYTATASAEYTSTYKLTLDLTGYKVKRGNKWKNYSDVADDFKDKIEDYCQDAKVVCTGASAKKTKDNFLFDDEYEYTKGTLTIEFSRINEQCDYSTWDNIVDVFNKNKTQKAVEEHLAAEGKVNIDFRSFNWNFMTAKVTVTDGKSVTAAGKGNTADAAKKAALAAVTNSLGDSQREAQRKKEILAAAGWSKNAVFTTSYTEKNSAAKDVKLTNTKYGYTATYDKINVTTKKDVVLKKVFQSAAELSYEAEIPAVTKKVYRNDKFFANEDCFYEFSDEAFRSFLAEGTASKEAYDSAVDNKTSADSEVERLTTAVSEAKKAVSEKSDELEAITEKYNKATEELDELKAKREEIKGKLADAEASADYSDAIEKVKAAKSEIADADAAVLNLSNEVNDCSESKIDSSEMLALNALIAADKVNYEMIQSAFEDTSDVMDEIDEILDNKKSELTKTDDADDTDAKDDDVTDDTDAKDDDVTDDTDVKDDDVTDDTDAKDDDASDATIVNPAPVSPAPVNPTPDSDTSDTDSTDNTDNTVNTNVVVDNTANTNVAADNTANTNVVVDNTDNTTTNNTAPQEIVEIEDNEVPLSSLTDKKDDSEEIVSIDENEVPLANVASPASKNMWWLLAIPVVGVVTFGFFMFFKKKKEKEEAEQ